MARDRFQENLEARLAGLAEDVGGPEVLETLSLDPLPNEPFDWSVVPADVHERVGDVLALLDRFLDAEFDDVELRTAGRRLLARIASRTPDIFRRNGKSTNAAASIAYLVVGDNELFSMTMRVQDLMRCFGVPGGTMSSRAETLLYGAGLRRTDPGRCSLPLDMLISSRRKEIARSRDFHNEMLARYYP